MSEMMDQEAFRIGLEAAYAEVMRQRPEAVDVSQDGDRTAILTFDAINLRDIVAAVLSATG